MAYTLSTAISELKWSMFWNERNVVREPLEGLVDSSNKVFYTAQKPISSTGITVYDNDGDEVSSGSYTVDSTEFGTVRFNTAPAALHYVSYTSQSLTDTMLTNIVKKGFDKMEQEYNRNWYITSDSISSSSSSIVDPVTGSYTFSTSRLQIGFYLLCCEYALVYALMKHAASNYFKYRESRSAGVQIDRTKNADQLRDDLGVLQGQIDDMVDTVANQQDDTPWGGWTPGSKSDQYISDWAWWPGGKQDRGEVA